MTCVVHDEEWLEVTTFEDRPGTRWLCVCLRCKKALREEVGPADDGAE